MSLIDKFNDIYTDFLRTKDSTKNTSIKGIKEDTTLAIIATTFFSMIFLVTSSVFLGSDISSKLWVLLGAVVACFSSIYLGKLYSKFLLKKEKKYLYKFIHNDENKKSFLELLYTGTINENQFLYGKEFGFDKNTLRNDLMSNSDLEKSKEILFNNIGEEEFRKIMKKIDIKSLISEQGGISYFCMARMFSYAESFIQNNKTNAIIDNVSTMKNAKIVKNIKREIDNVSI